MSDAAPTSAPQRGVREAIVHVAVVATAWALGQLGTHAVLVLSVQGFRDAYQLGHLLNIVRWAGVMGIAAAVATHRRQRSSPRRAALECAVLALVAWNVGIALSLGSDLSQELTGVGLPGAVSALGVDQALELYVGLLTSPWSYARIAAVAVGFYLAGSRRGTRWEGLALRGPTVLTSGVTGPISVVIVAVALPLLSRAADRYFARRAADT